MPLSERHTQQKSKNYALLALLVSLALVMLVLTVVKLQAM